MNKKAVAIIVALTFCIICRAQIDPVLLRIKPEDTLKRTMNMDAVYDRPLMDVGKLPVSVGGYMEVNWQHIGTDGNSEGHQFQFRRLTLFVSSTIGKRLKFLSEIEFEDGCLLPGAMQGLAYTGNITVITGCLVMRLTCLTISITQLLKIPKIKLFFLLTKGKLFLFQSEAKRFRLFFNKTVSSSDNYISLK